MTTKSPALLRVATALLVVACTATLIPAATASSQPANSFPKAGTILTTKLAVHSRPSRSSPTLKVLPQFRPDYRPTTLLVLGEALDTKGQLWLKLSIPIRPNGQTGWAQAATVQTRAIRRRIVVDLSARTLRVIEAGKTRYATRVAIGRPGSETPTGTFYITATFTPTEKYLGSYALETSAYSTLSEWPGGGIIGLHGTTTPHQLGKAISHGCIRMNNTAALVLKKLTPAGTPLRITK